MRTHYLRQLILLKRFLALYSRFKMTLRRGTLLAAMAVVADAAFVSSQQAPPSPSDLMDSIRAAMVAGKPGFTIPAGDYAFWSDYSSSAITMNGAANFVLDATGATFFIRPGQGLSISNATNLTLRGLTIDFPPEALHFSQGAVSDISVKPGNVVEFVLTLDAGYPELVNRYTSWMMHPKVIFWDASNRTMLHWQVQTTSTVHDATQLKPGVWRVTTEIGGPTAGHKPSEGNLATISPVLVPAIDANDCSGNLLEDVTLYGSSGMGYLESGGGGGTVIRRWRAVRQPGSDRLLSTTLDGVHSTSVEKGLLLEDSEVSFAADDLFAVHCELGITWGVAPAGSNSLYIVDTGGSPARTVALAQPGDTLHFFALNSTMEPLASAKVQALSVVDNATLQADAERVSEDIKAELHLTIRPIGNLSLLVRVDFDPATPLPASVLKRFSSLVQYDQRCGFGTVVRNTTLHDTTGGMRLKGVNVTVDGVSISRAYGMRMLPEPFWTQSVSRDITIRNSVFNVTGNAPAAPQSVEYVPATCPGLVLSNNTFIDSNATAIDAAERY